jgi:hypothetical protein
MPQQWTAYSFYRKRDCNNATFIPPEDLNDSPPLAMNANSRS